MSIEAMKQALEALESWHKGFPENMNDLDDQAITSLRQAIEQAEKQEPVAWMHTKLEGVVIPHRPVDLDRHPDRWEGLHKTPPPCPTCEALARTVMMDQTAHDTPPHQPLTDEQISDLWCKVSNTDFVTADTHEFARAIEAAHGIKEKNT